LFCACEKLDLRKYQPNKLGEREIKMKTMDQWWFIAAAAVGVVLASLGLYFWLLRPWGLAIIDALT